MRALATMVTESEFVDGRLPLARASEVARDLAAVLEPACRRVLIAGSIRRGREFVKDIELLVEPIDTEPGDMFTPNSFDVLINKLCEPGQLQPRAVNGRTAWGSRYKRCSWKRAAVDLFIVLPPAQWGLLALIRTGPAEFSKRLVTPVAHGGLLPNYLQVEDGALRWRAEKKAPPIPTPEEADVWTALGIAEIPIGDRR